MKSNKQAQTRDSYTEEFKSKQAKFSKDIEAWSEEERQEHFQKLEEFYSRDIRKTNLLGRFDFDPGYVYHHHTLDGNPTKLERRLSTGWSFASADDIKRAGIEQRSQNAEMFGETCITVDHGDKQACILKIPRALHEMNLKAKERLNSNKPILNHKGQIVNIKENIEETKTVRRRDEGEVSMDDVLNNF